MLPEGNWDGAESHDPAWECLRKEKMLAGWPVIFLDSVDSTNTYALSLDLCKATHGTIVLAETQSSGRGRLGRNWLSPPGCGLYVSILLRPTLSCEDLPRVTLAAGVAVCLAIEKTTSLQPKLKWPNDILLAGKKAGGILTETSGIVPGSAPAPLVVVGIGLNVNTPAVSFPAELAPRATSLRAVAGRFIYRSLVLAAIVEELDLSVSLLEQGDGPEIIRMWRRRDGTLGTKLTWVTPGHELVFGESLGIDDNGLLHIRDDCGQVHAVISGDLATNLRRDSP